MVFELFEEEEDRAEISISVSKIREYSVSNSSSNRPSRRTHHGEFFPCEIRFVDSVNYHVEPDDVISFTKFSLEYIDKVEEKPFFTDLYVPKFGGHQTLVEREESFYARNQTLHCGFIKGRPGHPSCGFDLAEKDKAYMNTCKRLIF